LGWNQPELLDPTASATVPAWPRGLGSLGVLSVRDQVEAQQRTQQIEQVLRINYRAARLPRQFRNAASPSIAHLFVTSGIGSYTLAPTRRLNRFERTAPSAKTDACSGGSASRRKNYRANKKGPARIARAGPQAWWFLIIYCPSFD
jgi:hypothetical protein